MTDTLPIDLKKLAATIEKARSSAIEYYDLMHRPLGITGEIGEYEAARLLNLRLVEGRTPGYDALKADTKTKVQIKTRCISSKVENKRRLPIIKLNHDWHVAILVLLDETFHARAIYEASRSEIEKIIGTAKDKRTQLGAIPVCIFKNKAKPVWFPQTYSKE